MNTQPKILFVTTPIRPAPTHFPPIGTLSLMSALRKIDHHNYSFFDIDCFRPDFEEVLSRIVDEEPAILAISAVVSTAYQYVKDLSLAIKQVMPHLLILVGGPLGASAEIILRKTGVDVVAIGEGELIIQGLAKAYDRNTGRDESLAKVKGLVYLDGDEIINTGYTDPIPKEAVYDIDYTDLERFSNIHYYVCSMEFHGRSHFEHDPRMKEPHRLGKSWVTVLASKGCVAKCTFCHRWDKGIRYIPVPIFIERLKVLIERYNVGFVEIGDENFGTSVAWLKEFCAAMSKLDVLWNVTGMRVNCISADKLQMMKKAGCVEAVFGMETGSERMLAIMNKGVELHHNYDALDYVHSNGMRTTVQLVLNMPGECQETIEETAEFIRYAVEIDSSVSPFNHSMNYAQALPGTPLYEYAIHEGLIGAGLEAEENYLMWISDKNAADENFTIFFNKLPRLQVLGWRIFLSAVALDAYKKKFGRRRYLEKVSEKLIISGEANSGYFNFPKEKWGSSNPESHASYLSLLGYVFRNPGKIALVIPGIIVKYRFVLNMLLLSMYTRKQGFLFGFELLRESLLHVGVRVFRPETGKFGYEYKSLRKTMKDDTDRYPEIPKAMLPLRLGRW